jgi:PEP-CTERM motif
LASTLLHGADISVEDEFMKGINVFKWASVAVGVAFGGQFSVADAALITLTFEGNICGTTGTSSCGNGAQIGENYGDSSLVNVSYRSIGTGSNTTHASFLNWWNSYGDLSGVVWGGGGTSGYISEIVIDPMAGYEISLVSLDMGSYSNALRTSQLSVFDASTGAAIYSSGTVPVPASGHSDFDLNLAYEDGGVRIQWGPDGYNVGLDNITFDIREITSTSVPEPGTLALFGAGLAAFGLLRRRKASI